MATQPVNRLPLGLLSLFDIKQMGAYPKDLAGTYDLNIDILPLMVSAGASYIGRTAAGAQITADTPGIYNLGPELAVPENEVWLVERCAVTAVLAADQYLRGVMVKAFNVAGVSVCGSNVGDETTVDGANARATFRQFRATNREPFVLAPGNSIRFNVIEGNRGAGGTINLNPEWRILRLLQ